MKINLDGTEGHWTFFECGTWVGSVIEAGIGWNLFCDRCGKAMRFTHTLCGPNGVAKPRGCPSTIHVGVDCAALLVVPDERHIPLLAEQETARKERWRRDRYNSPGVCKTTLDNLRERGKIV